MDHTAALKKTSHKVRIIILLGFLFGFSITLVAFVGSSYYKEAIGTDNVGIFFVVSYVLSLVILLNLHKLYIRFGRARTLLTTLFIQILVLALLTLLTPSLFGACVLVIYYVLYNVVWVLWDAVLEAYSTDGATGRIRGLFLSVWGVGTILGPLASTSLLDRFGDFSAIFTAVLVLYIIMLSIAMIAFHAIRGKIDTTHVDIKGFVKRVYQTPALWQAYWVSATLAFFFAIFTVFMPLYLLEIGFSWQELGLMFTIMLIPFMLLEYPAGLLADTRWGEKEILFVGQCIILVAVVMIYLMESSSFWMWTSILVFSRMGCALVESMRDVYFYKHVDGEDVGLINFFRTGRSVAFIVATALSSMILIFFPLKAVFVLVAIVLVVGFYPIVKMIDTEPSRS